jgi:hypothetical protein
LRTARGCAAEAADVAARIHAGKTSKQSVSEAVTATEE